MNIDDIMTRTFEPLGKGKYATQEDKQEAFQVEFDRVEIGNRSKLRHSKRLQGRIRVAYGVEVSLVNRDAVAMIEGRK